MNRLHEICDAKRNEVAVGKKAASIGELERRIAEQDAPRGFQRALEDTAAERFALIAEVKRASPSRGVIRQTFQPAAHARAYAAGGATCLSVLTDGPFFGGSANDLVQAKSACQLPILRKDFMVDPWQVAEARAMGADAILIIVAALDMAAMEDIEAAAMGYNMDVLVEVHDEHEMEKAARLRSRMIGVNNRDLRTFVTDLSVSERLAPFAPPGSLLVSESGVHRHEDLQRLTRAGFQTFLVGEALMRHEDLETATRTLLLG